MEAQRAHLEAELTQLDQVDQLAQLDLPQLEMQVKDQVQRWRSALRQSPDAARSVARKLLTGRLTFTPGVDTQGRPYYQVTGSGKLDGLDSAQSPRLLTHSISYRGGGPNGLPPPLARASARNFEGSLSDQPPSQVAEDRVPLQLEA